MMGMRPFEDVDRLFEQMRRSMMDLGALEDAPGMGTGVGSTNLHLETADDGYVVHADLPGFETDEVDLRFDDGLLRIEAVHEHESDDAVRSRRITEQVRIPGTVEVDGITASLRNGVLEVHLPTETGPEETGHRIDVE